MSISGPEIYNGYPTLGIASRWLQAIINGSKVVEGRKKNPIRDQWLNKQVILWADEDGPGNFQSRRKVLVKITAIRCYDDIITFLLQEEYEKLVPGIATCGEAYQLYNKLYPPEEIVRVGGMCALQLEVLNSDWY